MNSRTAGLGAEAEAGKCSERMRKPSTRSRRKRSTSKTAPAMVGKAGSPASMQSIHVRPSRLSEQRHRMSGTGMEAMLKPNGTSGGPRTTGRGWERFRWSARLTATMYGRSEDRSEFRFRY